MKPHPSTALVLSLLLACGDDDSGPTRAREDAGSDVDGGESRADAGSADAARDGAVGDMRGDASGDAVCTVRLLSARATAPEVLLVLDRSQSTLAQRWAPSVTAVNALTGKLATQVSFGLSLFPGPNGLCSVAALDVPVKLDNAAPISSFLAATAPTGITPTPQALKAALGYLGDRKPTGNSQVKPAYVVLVTDGEPDCPDGDFPDPAQGTLDAAGALLAANIKTYTVGYDLPAPGKALLDEVALAGGTAASYSVTSAEELSATLSTITGGLLPCEYELDQVPAATELVRVIIDRRGIKPDASNGWVLAGKTLTFHGEACALLRSGEPHAVSASLECEPISYL